MMIIITIKYDILSQLKIFFCLVSINLSIHKSINRSIYHSINLSIYLSINLSIWGQNLIAIVFVCTSITNTFVLTHTHMWVCLQLGYPKILDNPTEPCWVYHIVSCWVLFLSPWTIGLIYGRYLQFRILKFPLIVLLFWSNPSLFVVFFPIYPRISGHTHIILIIHLTTSQGCSFSRYRREPQKFAEELVMVNLHIYSI